MPIPEIPPEFSPDPAQIPPWATDETRFRLCFAITRAVAQRDDPVFCRELYFGDMSTDDLIMGTGPNAAPSEATPADDSEQARDLRSEIYQPPPLIRNRDLESRDVPAFDVRALHPNFIEAPSAAQWLELWNFALTFDGYRFAGLDSGGLSQLAYSVRHDHESGGDLHIHDLSWLRALLYLEQRRTRATNDSGRIDPRYAAYLQVLLEAIREVLDRRVRLLETKRLRASDVPDPAGADVWRFARTFDAYQYFAVRDIHGRLGEFARSVRHEFFAAGGIPRLGEIGMLRACLFYEERRACMWSEDDDGLITAEDERYLAALLQAIRDRLGDHQKPHTLLDE